MLNLVLHNPQYWLPEWLFSAVHACGAGGCVCSWQLSALQSAGANAWQSSSLGPSVHIAFLLC